MDHEKGFAAAFVEVVEPVAADRHEMGRKRVKVLERGSINIYVVNFHKN
jgi:hypothetical protein